MAYPNTYRLKVEATNPSDLTQSVTKWSTVATVKGNLTVFVHGGDRSASVSHSNYFFANVNPESSSLIYRWICIDEVTKTYCKSKTGKYLVFPNLPNMTIPSGTLMKKKQYRIRLDVKDTISNYTGTHSVMVTAYSDTQMSVEIDSRHNENGYIDYTEEVLIIGVANINGTFINVANATFTWVISDSQGNQVDLASATKVQNSIKLPARTLVSDNIYNVYLTVNYMNVTGTATIEYSTMIDSYFSFEVEPSTGVAFSTDFIITAASQNVNIDTSTYVFGYLKGSVEHYLSRGSVKSMYILKLPQGESSDQLTLFVRVFTKQKKTYYFEKTITVTATTTTATEFSELVSSTHCDSIDESIQIRMMYEHFKATMPSERLQALELMLDGFERDSSNLQPDQDEESSYTIAEILKTIAADFLVVNDASILTRAFEVFTQMAITENDKISSDSMYIEFSLETVENFFKFADHCLSALNLVGKSQQWSMRKSIQTGMANLIKGSMIHVAPGDAAYSIDGTNIAIISGKITANGYQGSAKISPLTSVTSRRSLYSKMINITIPGSAMPSSNYLQVTIVNMMTPAYIISPGHSEGSVKSGMVSISLEENDSSLAAVGTRVYSNEIVMNNLVDPILIEIPYDGTIGRINTIS